MGFDRYLPTVQSCCWIPLRTGCILIVVVYVGFGIYNITQGLIDPYSYQVYILNGLMHLVLAFLLAWALITEDTPMITKFQIGMMMFFCLKVVVILMYGHAMGPMNMDRFYNLGSLIVDLFLCGYFIVVVNSYFETRPQSVYEGSEMAASTT